MMWATCPLLLQFAGSWGKQRKFVKLHAQRKLTNDEIGSQLQIAYCGWQKIRNKLAMYWQKKHKAQENKGKIRKCVQDYKKKI